jgi:serine/threonine protein kinase
LGCLLYEILTGEFLFYDNDWVHFYIRVTSPNEVLLTNDKLKTINHNIYLVDFLKYILVKEPQHRPNIDNVLKRFEHIHALLVSNSAYSQGLSKSSLQTNNLPLNFSIDEALDTYECMINEFSKLAMVEKFAKPVKLKHVRTLRNIYQDA